MRRRTGTFCMFLGAVLVLAALSLFLWNRSEEARAEKSVGEILPQVLEQVEALKPNEGTGRPILPDPYDPEMAESEIGGYLYIGYLSIPSLGLELPVMSNWSYQQLKISPCRYSGSARTGDLVIAAHNYSCHFGNIKNMSVGDTVIFTGMDGAVFAYEVAETGVLSPDAAEEMTDGGHALTLFTCTYSGQGRITVRCDLSE